MRERFTAWARDAVTLTVRVAPERSVTGVVHGVGADWFALDHGMRREGPAIVPLHAVREVTVTAPAALDSLRPGDVSRLSERITFGFVMRDLSRKRSTVRIVCDDDTVLDGTIDRAAADHADLAIHDRSEPRRDRALSSFRIVAFSAIAVVHADAPLALP